MATTRVTGRRWSVAMRDAEWNEVVGIACPTARARLIVMLEHFCDHGERDLPANCFNWQSRGAQKPGTARQGAFEARGVVLRGHASDRVFFATSVEVDPAAPAAPRRGRRGQDDDRQGQLPLARITPQGEENG